MKGPFEVLWAAAAERDLFEIVGFIADDNPAAAVRVLSNVKAAVSRLDRSPGRGRVVPELLKQGISRYREIVIRPWRVIYRADDRKVYVLVVIDGRRNVEDLLLARLLR